MVRLFYSITVFTTTNYFSDESRVGLHTILLLYRFIFINISLDNKKNKTKKVNTWGMILEAVFG